ncbi:MAG TPA: ATP-binding protein [Thermoleophilaceae bacterium]|nr:ATP-binding protein [Thermoleophilaceae bacterium]
MVLVLAAAGAFVYLRLSADLTESVDNGLRSRADDFVAAPSGRPLLEPEEGFAQLLADGGRVVAQSGGARGPALTQEEAATAGSSPRTREREVEGVEGTARVLDRRVSVEGRPRVVVVGASLEDRDETLAGLAASFAIGGPLAVLAAAGLGYLLAGAGLAPVEAMRRRAEQVSLRRAGERLPLPAADDEIRRLGETLNDMLARLEASFERERRFVADASHELRTPLSVLKTELESALRRAGDDPARRESLLAALEETDHLAQLAGDLLLLAQAGEGRLSMRPETVEVRGLLEQARERFADRARERGREIRVDAPVALTVQADPVRLRQALGNLVDNALRHGDGEIELAGRQLHDGAVGIRVSDAGPGFPAELAPQAFERFARGDGARTRGGAGLGLAIVRAIADAHGGGAAIVERGGGGAAVELRLRP